MKFGDFVKVKSLSSAQGFKENLQRLGLPMPCDEQLESGDTAAMAQPLTVSGLKSATDTRFTPWKAGTVWPMAVLLTTLVVAGAYLAAHRSTEPPMAGRTEFGVTTSLGTPLRLNNGKC
jgi:hypothetical protein